MGALGNIFKKIANARDGKTGRWFKPGAIYKLTLKNMFIKTDGQDGNMFIAETLVREAKRTDPGDKAINEPGTDASFVVNLDNKAANGSQYSDVKEFLCALLGIEPVTGPDGDAQFAELCNKLLNDEEIDEVVDGKKTGKKFIPVKEQPLRGKTIVDDCFEKPQKKNKDKMFTHHNWSYVDEDDATLAANRAMLDKGAVVA